MGSAHEFLVALTTVLCVAAATTVLFQWLKQPVVLGYLLAGFLLGPNVPLFPLFADEQIVRTLSELGVILLMFSLGLEFSLRKLMRVGATSGLTAVIETSLMVWVGVMVARGFGWTTNEALFTGAIVAISSTTIIAKTFAERRVRGVVRDTVLGILVAEDLIAILLLAALTAISTGRGLHADAMVRAMGTLAAFLIGVVALGLWVVPRAVRAIVRLKRPETTLVAVIGICFALALLAQVAGYSVALGAFLAGALVGESGHERSIAELVHPVRDVFAAIFFVSVGMLIQPELVLEHWVAVVVLTLVVLVGKILAVSVGAFLTGHGTRTSLQAGMSLAQIGEFSFIIAGLGLGLGATGQFLYPVAVAVSAITTLTTPWLVRASGATAALVDRKLPHALQTFSTLYASWVERLRSGAPAAQRGVVARIIRVLLIDVGMLAGLVILTALSIGSAAAFVRDHLEVGPDVARLLVLAGAAAVAAPFWVGLFRSARHLGVTLAEQAWPKPATQRVDLALAPRSALAITIQLGVLVLVGVPLLAVTQPFLPGPQGALLLLFVLAALGVVFWRRATNLEGHVRAGAQVIAEALAAQTSSDDTADQLGEVRELLPGLGEPVPVRIASETAAVGRSLAQLNLRGLTGATVLAIRRGTEVVVPGPHEALQAGDIVALAGTHEAIDAARAVLTRRDSDPAEITSPPAT